MWETIWNYFNMAINYFNVILIGGVCLWYILANLAFNKTTYHKATHRSFLKTVFDKGFYGEYLIYKKFRKFEKTGARFLFNCYLPKEDGETSEVDVLMLYGSGIYVFESKNYGGRIYGDEKSLKWMQILFGKRSRFYNPIMQNATHIKYLKAFIGDEMPCRSVIVFSKRCVLAKMEIESPEILVARRVDLHKCIKPLKKKDPIILYKEEIEELYKKLYPLTQVTEDIKKKHVENIKEKHKNS
ncbi:MAG: NERD domain-containing protein [Lachnospiraceae bacterium]|nr:NERD domain-containing protein [Lachnospiraceae bacterium]